MQRHAIHSREAPRAEQKVECEHLLQDQDRPVTLFRHRECELYPGAGFSRRVIIGRILIPGIRVTRCNIQPARACRCWREFENTAKQPSGIDLGLIELARENILGEREYPPVAWAEQSGIRFFLANLPNRLKIQLPSPDKPARCCAPVCAGSSQHANRRAFGKRAAANCQGSASAVFRPSGVIKRASAAAKASLAKRAGRVGRV